MHKTFALALFLLSSFLGISTDLAAGGPPPWAKAHGARAQRAYVYYPGASVYFDVSARQYFYLNGGNWVVAASLPLGFLLGPSVSLQLATPTPYLFHTEHLQLYPPAKYKVKVGKGPGGGGGKFKVKGGKKR